MLFRPPVTHRLDAARNLLDDWNAEADRFRRAATLAAQGEMPSPALLEAAGEVEDGLEQLIADIDGALERIAPGHADFGRLLQAQITAIALLESVGRSRDMLARVVPTAFPDNMRLDAAALN